MKERDVIKLSKEDSERFVEFLLNPPPPNENLIRAFREHHKMFSSYECNRDIPKQQIE